MKNTLFYFAVVPALFFQIALSYLYFNVFEGSDAVTWLYSCTKILLIAWPSAWLLAAKKHLPKMFGREWRRSILAGIISGIIIVGIGISIYLSLTDYLSGFADNIYEKIIDFKIENYYIPFALFVSIIHSFIEEYYWRWFVFSGLMLKLKKNAAILISSAAFGIHHYIILSQFFDLPFALFGTFAVFVGGVIWCNIYKKTGNLLGAWISHFCADAIVMTLGYFIVF